MKKIVTLYYLGLGAISLFFMIYTIYVGSLYIHFGQQIKKLTVKKNNLIQIQQSLSADLSQELTALKIKDYAQTEGFIPVQGAVIIERSDSLAADTAL